MERKRIEKSLGVSRRAWLRDVGISTLGLALGGSLLGQASGPAAKRLERYPELKHINLAGNENPFGPSQKVSMAIMREVKNSCRYPFREEEILKERIAEKEGLKPENVILGNGCDEILSLAGIAFGGDGNTVVATRPTYLQLAEQAEKAGGHVEWVDHSVSMHHDLGAMMERSRRKSANLVYICNPDTPSGTVLPPEEIRSFCVEACKTSTVFLDEVYLDLLDDYEQQTQVDLIREGYPLIIGRSFSKMHGLAGHRIGYAIASKEIVQEMGKRKMSSPGYLGVIAALASLDDRDFHEQSKRLIAKGRERFCSQLDSYGLKYTPSVGNFVFHHTGIEVREFQKRMKAHGFLVGRPFPPYEDWCRISIGTPAEMSAYEGAMAKVFGA
ncbi:pyridoxal phosphate-dependent aminotransferase [Pelagicoccus mobilis]|uniref:Aminotransferase n=1 Tax=Pelagicoccus mobilis TaxID=415221 RepID=A0A934RV04_9BACT|nr:histidinol-phosphate transaminase [Pelagicoccus mobilis]MBK1876956.1 histidinol-phosphate aminotransferase family protein [Pelagicoccus mobilis]